MKDYATKLEKQSNNTTGAATPPPSLNVGQAKAYAVTTPTQYRVKRETTLFYNNPKKLQVMNTKKINPRHRVLIGRLSTALFEMMTNPTELRVIVELNAVMDQYRNDADPLHHYYMIDGAYIDEENAREGCDMVQYKDGYLSVMGHEATEKSPRNCFRDVHPQAVASWVSQMIQRDRVRDVWAESY